MVSAITAYKVGLPFSHFTPPPISRLSKTDKSSPHCPKLTMVSAIANKVGLLFCHFTPPPITTLSKTKKSSAHCPKLTTVSAIAGVHGPSGCRRDVRPPMHTYSPSMWGDIFSAFSFDDQVQEMYAEAIEALKKEAKIMLMAATSDKLIILIDTLQRLGLAHHFDTEIEEKLEEIYNFHANPGDEDEDYDLFTVALRFRLLRQHRYHVSCGVFDKFIDRNNKFKETLSSDVEGLLNLYEAAHVQIHEEDIFEEAVAFTTHHLTRMVQQLQSPLQDKVKQALEHPLHTGAPILQARHYISIYEKDESRDELLLKLAKLNFNFLQNLYKKELCELSGWWNRFDLKSKLPYVRDRLIECFLWSVILHFEPQYSDLRIASVKAAKIVTVLDDTYDNYATLDEAQLFTDILERWNIDEIDPLPEYMKIVYRFLMSIYKDYERDATKQDKSFAISYFREAVKQLCRVNNQEQIWVMERQIPSLEDYSANAPITSGVYMLFISLIPCLKHFTKEIVDWLLSEPKIVISTARMVRCFDDLGSHEREDKGGKMLTVVDYYMKNYGLSKQETLCMLIKRSKDGWKDLNAEWVARTSMPKHMVELLLLNYVRGLEISYKISEDGYTNPEKRVAPLIATLFVDPLLI